VNWWGGSTQAFVAGRIWERRDSDYLIQVNFDNFFTTNTTILQGKCQPGWRLISEKCYYYMGGTLPYSDAEYQCKVGVAAFVIFYGNVYEKPNSIT
jgi:hypothetical protein